jgi:TonB family protein
VRIGLTVVLALLIWETPRPPAQTDRQMCLCEFVAPIYPPLARLSRMQGTVRIGTTPDSTGNPQEIEALQDGNMQPTTMEILQRASIDALRKWRFCPAGTSDHPRIVVAFKFKLIEDATQRFADQWYPTDVGFQSPATVQITTTNATVHTE